MSGARPCAERVRPAVCPGRLLREQAAAEAGGAVRKTGTLLSAETGDRFAAPARRRSKRCRERQGSRALVSRERQERPRSGGAVGTHLEGASRAPRREARAAPPTSRRGERAGPDRAPAHAHTHAHAHAGVRGSAARRSRGGGGPIAWGGASAFQPQAAAVASRGTGPARVRFVPTGSLA